ncbi:hypothetical protein AV955_gp019 [Diadromus pulchellus ascovirus 4a]|uniref:Major capsid protein n=1 Tax=Diadromus pulchellus ascovirus 4a TaxID=158683 RepID=F2NYU8_9VIRU|nr:hypothetical protein AV955_gp019 [Diadromus pulchellus ascovirus 4a]CCA61376.1 unnamed protein product [Diadromus pulchellus ascovirus 4a]
MAVNKHLIDMQSFGELENHLYDTSSAYSYFKRDYKKTSPVFKTPVVLDKTTGTSSFSYDWSAFVDKTQGDYLTNLTLIVKLPELKLKPDNAFKEKGTIRWTKNLFHNLLEECTLTFNDTVVNRLDSCILDFISEFSVDESKYSQYMKNIGNQQCLLQPATVIPSRCMVIPIPFFFNESVRNALPLSEMPYTEIKINFKFRAWESLVLLENKTELTPVPIVPVAGRDLDTPVLEEVKLYGTFVSVSEEERRTIGVRPSTMVFKQYQILPRQKVTDEKTKIQLMFKHSVTKIYFGIRNSTFKNQWSNYTADNDIVVNQIVSESKSESILKSARISYNGKDRIPETDASYFKMIEPIYCNRRVPEKEGHFVYNFDIMSDSPYASGSLAVSRLNNPTMELTVDREAIRSDRQFEFITIAENTNVITISEGNAQVPVLH